MLVQDYPSFGSTNLIGKKRKRQSTCNVLLEENQPNCHLYARCPHMPHMPHQHRATSPFTAGKAVKLYQVSFYLCQPVLSFGLRWLSAEVSGTSCEERLVSWAVLSSACWKAQESRNTLGMLSPKYSLLFVAIAWYFISSRYSGVSFSYKKETRDCKRQLSRVGIIRWNVAC